MTCTGAQVLLAARCAAVVAAHGDNLLHSGARCASTSTASARAIALLTHEPGGSGSPSCGGVATPTNHSPHEPTPCLTELARAEHTTTCPECPR